MYGFKVRSKKLSEDLNRKGCFYNKSLTLKPPSNDVIPDELFRHFIRGMVDGDGCIAVYKNKCMTSLTSTIEFNTFLKEYIQRLGITSSVRLVNKSSITSSLCVGDGRAGQVKFLSWLYDDCEYKIDRKYQKYQEISKIYLQEQDG